MGRNSRIEWCDHTHNHWIGCAKDSAGCMNCYAERDMDHRFGRVVWGPRGTRVLTAEKNRQRPYHWNKQARKKGQVETVFTASLADVFEEWHDITLMNTWRAELFQMMEETPWLVWLVLTKRPQNVLHMVPDRWRTVGLWPDNVWVGFSAEDQGNFDFRMASAINIPSPVRWVSAEPLLGRINMTDYLETYDIQWVIAGGESGPKARPTRAKWVGLLMEECAYTNVPFFFKQWGEWLPNHQMESYLSRGGDPNKGYTKTTVQGEMFSRTGKAKAGRLLDGQGYSQFPRYLEEYEQEMLE